jgi:alpha-tubulin suppressor-like RCC1 family protein
LGTGDTNPRYFPTMFYNSTKITYISSNYEHSLICDEYGSVYSFGTGLDGQLGKSIKFLKLGLGNGISIFLPTLIPNLYNITKVSTGFSFSICLDNIGNVYSFGLNTYNQLGLNIPTYLSYSPLKLSITNITQISTGCYSTLLLNNKGDVYGFGDNTVIDFYLNSYIN